MPILFGVTLLAWGIVRFACLRGLDQAHLQFGGRLTLAQAASLLALAIAADLGHCSSPACLWPAQHH